MANTKNIAGLIGPSLIASEDARLAMALYITHSVHAPAKGALGVMAVYGLMSKYPFTRAAMDCSDR